MDKEKDFLREDAPGQMLNICSVIAIVSVANIVVHYYSHFTAIFFHFFCVCFRLAFPGHLFVRKSVPWASRQRQRPPVARLQLSSCPRGRHLC